MNFLRVSSSGVLSDGELFRFSMLFVIRVDARAVVRLANLGAPFVANFHIGICRICSNLFSS
jgi:hypothetical protein